MKHSCGVDLKRHKRPLAKVQPIAEELVALLSPSCERISIGGSIRRKCAEVGDIELVAIPRLDVIAVQEADFWNDPPKEHKVNLLWAKLDALAEKMSPRFEKIRWGDKYRAFHWPLPHEVGSIQVDCFTACADSWGLQLLIRTGNADFSRHVVTALKRRGTPSSDGYVRGSQGTPIPTPTEEEVFRLAGMRYYAPEERSW